MRVENPSPDAVSVVNGCGQGLQSGSGEGRGIEMDQREDEIDQFQILEEKIESLVRYVASVRKEKEELAEKTRVQEGKIAALASDVERLIKTREKARERIVSLLEKLNQAGV